MAKSVLPLEERIFIALPAPEVIITGTGDAIGGPFCVNCGNNKAIHRASDGACPVRRLHPELPMGKRERCNCRLKLRDSSAQTRLAHEPSCNRVRYGFNGTITR
jgi:hypothetical protein